MNERTRQTIGALPAPIRASLIKARYLFLRREGSTGFSRFGSSPRIAANLACRPENPALILRLWGEGSLSRRLRVGTPSCAGPWPRTWRRRAGTPLPAPGLSRQSGCLVEPRQAITREPVVDRLHQDLLHLHVALDRHHVQLLDCLGLQPRHGRALPDAGRRAVAFPFPPCWCAAGCGRFRSRFWRRFTRRLVGRPMCQRRSESSWPVSLFAGLPADRQSRLPLRPRVRIPRRCGRRSGNADNETRCRMTTGRTTPPFSLTASSASCTTRDRSARR